jgi:sulfide dehydrogenase [flavocytochrome c] flavoprotein chain
LQGKQPDQDPSLANTCYSMVSNNEAVHVANVFRFNAEKQAMVSADGGGVSSTRSEAEGAYAASWLQNILSDALL